MKASRGQLRLPGHPLEPETERPHYAPTDRCLLDIADLQRLLGEEMNNAGYKKTYRFLKQLGVLVRLGRRWKVPRDTVSEKLPQAAMRLAIEEANETLRDLTW